MRLNLPVAIDGHPFRKEVALLFQAALLIFIFTVVVGILNGTDAVDFGQKTILTHVHTGTLGWLTLSVFATSLWLFGQGELTPGERTSARFLSYAAVVSFLAYNGAFLTTAGTLRPTLGGFALATIAGFLVWIAVRARSVEITTPHVGILAAVGTSVVGGVLGVLLGIKIATGDNVLPEGGEDAHPATMVIGFLIPVGMALAEWALAWPKPALVNRLGVMQMVLPFIGGGFVATGLLLDAPPLIGLSLPFELAGVGIFLRRMWPLFKKVDWRAASPSRFATVAAAAIAVDLAIFVYLVARYEGDFDNAPTHQVLALDHVMFIGVMTNAILALLFSLLAGRTSWLASVQHVVFLGMNAGLAGFAMGLFFDVSVLKQVSTPVLGGAILVAIVAVSLSLLRSPATQPQPAVGPAA